MRQPGNKVCAVISDEYQKHYFNELYFLDHFRFTIKLNGRYGGFLYTPYLYTYIDLPIVNTPHISNTFVTIDESTLTHSYHPKFIIYMREHTGVMEPRFGCLLFENQTQGTRMKRKSRFIQEPGIQEDGEQVSPRQSQVRTNFSFFLC